MKKGFEMSAGAVLLLSALVFFCGWRELLALLLAAAVHEAGHLLALKALGSRITGFYMDGAGACIRHQRPATAAGEALAAFAGPFAGALGAAAFFAMGVALDSGLLLRAAVFSLALTVFNLLPAPRLDGGRIVEALAGERAAAKCGGVAVIAVLAAGLALIASGAGFWLFIAGAWLCLCEAGL